MTLVLGLDMSSTTIGYALSTGDAWGHHDLTGGIDARCVQAADYIAELLDTYRPALVVIESPVARFAKAVIPQARVSGAVLAALARRQALWCEVSPAVAKQVLAGSGSADKATMVEAAARRLGIAGDVRAFKSKMVMSDSAGIMLTEDEADAYALALTGAAMKVQVAA